ncbi:MAG: 2-amino-4-hydroxy-6-hydroxymethyldihydropteridine diphosphokinase [Chloroflexi bacterium]|nr:2-amino-4-hydroxy-6-hydroxymethyldihydropteridine diphosphokinase [Chloroflexota bacterium]
MTQQAVAAWVCLGLGANLGDRRANLERALAALREAVTVEVLSSIYETDPVGYANQPPFLNVALRGWTELSPHALLALAKRIEAGMGRIPSFQNAPRPIDIDILLYGYGNGGLFVMRSPDLVVPHPRMHERAFVLVPLAEIAPDVIHPVLGRTIAALRDAVGTAGVRWWEGWEGSGKGPG